MAKAFFLDRDGVINECHSVNEPEQFVMLEGVGRAVRTLNELGFEVFVVTNQGGVGLGYMTEQQLEAVHAKMVRLIEADGGKIAEVRACIHKPSHCCYCRKPKPGMITDLLQQYELDPKRSFMIGDRDVDITAGQKAGVRTVLIAEAAPKHVKPDYRFDSLPLAVEGLREQGII